MSAKQSVRIMMITLPLPLAAGRRGAAAARARPYNKAAIH
jgi:hypothetical protein